MDTMHQWSLVVSKRDYDPMTQWAGKCIDFSQSTNSVKQLATFQQGNLSAKLIPRFPKGVCFVFAQDSVAGYSAI